MFDKFGFKDIIKQYSCGCIWSAILRLRLNDSLILFLGQLLLPKKEGGGGGSTT